MLYFAPGNRIDLPFSGGVVERKKRAMESVTRVGNTVGTNVKGIPLSKASEWEVQAILGESRTCVLSCLRPG